MTDTERAHRIVSDLDNAVAVAERNNDGEPAVIRECFVTSARNARWHVLHWLLGDGRHHTSSIDLMVIAKRADELHAEMARKSA